MADFTFGNVTLSPNTLFGISIDQSEIFSTPEKDYEFVDVPGRNGSISFYNNRFKDIVIPVNCFIRTDFTTKFKALMNYLLSTEGYQELSLPQDASHYRMGIFYNATEPETGSFNKSGHFTLNFRCKPQRYLITGRPLLYVPSGNTLTNPTNFNAKPMVRFYGNGTATINGYQITVAGREANTYIDIDSETMTCTNESTNLSSYVTLSNGYPELKPGANEVTYTTDSTHSSPLQMRYRWWEL